MARQCLRHCVTRRILQMGQAASRTSARQGCNQERHDDLDGPGDVRDIPQVYCSEQ